MMKLLYIYSHHLKKSELSGLCRKKVITFFRNNLESSNFFNDVNILYLEKDSVKK